MSRSSGTTTPSAATLVELLQSHTAKHPDRRAYTFLTDGESDEVVRTYRQLAGRARAIAARLQQRGAEKQRVLLLYPPGLEFLDAFFGCVCAGVVAVPSYPPRPNRSLQHLENIATDSGATLVLSSGAHAADLRQRLPESRALTELEVVATDEVGDDEAEQWREPDLDGRDLAFLQYTSGSTGTPKGVMVSHANILACEEMICRAFEHSRRPFGLGWLPMHHDMGLIGNALQAVYVGSQCVLMSPVAFLQKPLRWLQGISRYRATTSGGPNFAYEMCVRSITDEQKETLDLRSWDVAFTGAEPVRADTLRRFAEAFRPCGFRPEAFYPCYGMAEATLLVTGGKKRRGAVVQRLDRDALQRHRAVVCDDTVELPPGEQTETSEYVECGHPRPGTEVVIVDPETGVTCAEDEIGEVWISGPAVTQGYWGRPEESAKTFGARLADGSETRYLRSGDLGCLHQGRLIVTGRLKNVIIIRGRNYYPQDIERTVAECNEAFRSDAGAVFAVDRGQDQQLIVAHEVERRRIRDLDIDELAACICQAVAEQHDLQVDTVLLMKPSGVPRTSSGKVRHHACREAFLDGTLPVVARWDRSTARRSGSAAKAVADSAARPASEATVTIRDWLRTQLAQRLGVSEREIDIQAPFARYGLDSVTAVSLAESLSQWLRRPLAPTLAYDYPNIDLLSRHLGEEAEQDGPARSVPADEPAADDAIAVVGLACRLPGADSPDEFWRVLHEGIDCIGRLPPTRRGAWAERILGGFLRGVDEFDAALFGVSAAEAENMDPQHRLLLESAWEALEHAGIAPDRLGGSDTGVFVGISSNDYGRMQQAEGVEVNAYSSIGNALSIAANRLSYALDLRGPSWAVDTACSSSLVAVHQACGSLRRGECGLALAGGVNLILSPEVTVAFDRAGILAPDGRCKTFDASANGYVRGEGCGVIVLKRLRDAQRDGDRVLALVRGSAVNQDGRTNGLTAPNGPAQQKVIRQALAAAAVRPAEIGYVETHGTGTALGDPIEVNSLRAVLEGEAASDGSAKTVRCAIGSVKTNIGHLEAAAGIAGLIKVVLALWHEEIPPHLHLHNLNPHIALGGSNLTIPTQPQPWPRGAARRLAGVSSFGFGGTNAHVILEEAPAADPDRQESEEDTGRPRHLFTLSGRDEKAMHESARRWAERLRPQRSLSLADVCYTAATGRAHLPHRLAVVTDSVESLRSDLAALAGGRPVGNVATAATPRWDGRRLAFLFTGQGSQHLGMGRELYRGQPVFRDTIDRCDALLEPELGRSLRSVFDPRPGDEDLLAETTYAQPALFVLEYALAQLWKSWGIEPAAVMGHSLGEYAAACVAGVFSLEDGLKLVARRAALTHTLPPGGRMAAVMAEPARVADAIGQQGGKVAIAAINAPAQVVVSGPSEEVDALLGRLEAQGVAAQQLAVPYAFHSPLVEPILERFEACCREVTFHTPKVEIVSNLDGRLRGAEVADPQYWCRQTRNTVQFAASMKTLEQRGIEVFLEIGPKPTLLGLGRRCLEGAGRHTWLASLHGKRSDWLPMLESLRDLYLIGAPIDFGGFERGYRRRRLALPTYPFERRRYWYAANARPAAKLETARPPVAGTGHPLLGTRLRSAGHQVIYESHLASGSTEYIRDHRIAGQSILSVGSYLEMAVAASLRQGEEGPSRVEDLTIHRPLVLGEAPPATLQLVLTPSEQGAASVEVFRLRETDTEGAWQSLAAGRVSAPPDAGQAPRVDPEAIRSRVTESVAAEAYYRECQKRGFEFGPSLRAISRLWRGPWQALAEIRQLDSTPAAESYRLHPAVLDAACQVAGAAVVEVVGGASYLPEAVKVFTVWGPLEPELRCHARLAPTHEPRPATLTTDIVLYAPDGRVVAEIAGLKLRRVPREALLKGTESLDDLMYETRWQPAPSFADCDAEEAPAPVEICRHLEAQIEPLRADQRLRQYVDLLGRLEEVSVAFAIKALRAAGWQFQPGEAVSADGLAGQLEIAEPHFRLLCRLLEMLAEEGILSREADTWRVVRAPDRPNPQQRLAELLQEYPEADAELTLLCRCGAALADVLRGRCDPLEVLFPGGQTGDADRLYRESPGAKVMNRLVAETLDEIVRSHRGTRPLRVLEIGAGTGGTTAALLPRLPQDNTEYVLTDVSPLFVALAKPKFTEYRFIRYEVLDVERAPQEQGFEIGSYDLILAANVLHATRDLRKSLENVKSLLADGGMLILLEGTRPQRWLDLIFGLTEGWWRFDDAPLRTSHPLLSAPSWQTLLEHDGFEQAAFVAPAVAEEEAAQSVILARAPRRDDSLSARSNWLILADRQGVGDRLAELLRCAGARCTVARSAETAGVGPKAAAAEEVVASEDDFRRVVAKAIGSDKGRPLRIVHLWSLDAAPVDRLDVEALGQASRLGCGATLRLLGALGATETASTVSLLLVTRAAVSVSPNDSLSGLAQSPLWGLGNAIPLEHANVRCAWIDLDAQPSEDEAKRLLQEVLAADAPTEGMAEDRVALRREQRFVPRLVPMRLPRGGKFALRPDASYLVTGGLGTLGLRTADWLVMHGARHLLLAGRTGLPDRDRWNDLPRDCRAWRQVEVIRRLEARGTRVDVCRVDVGNPWDLGRLFDWLREADVPLRGVVHAAGASHYQSLAEMTCDGLEAVLRPKAYAAWMLLEQTKRHDLDFFVCFSSISSHWGTKGQGHYSAANQFLDELAHYARRRGVPSLTVNWGLWEGGGLADEVYRSWTAQHGVDQQEAERGFDPFGGRVDAAYRSWLAQLGIEQIHAEQALEALGSLVGAKAVQATVASVDWQRFTGTYQMVGRPSLLRHMLQQPGGPAAARSSASEPDQETLRDTLLRAPSSARGDLLVEHIGQQIARMLGVDAAQLDVSQPLNSVGLDSLMAIELRNRVKTELGIDIPMVTFMEGPNIADIACFLNDRLGATGGEAAGGDGSARAEVPPRRETSDAVAGRSERPSTPHEATDEWVEGEL